MKPTQIISVFVACVFLAGCGFVHDEKIAGNYRLIAVDVLSEMSVSYGLENGDVVGRINSTVFAVGWDSRYIVAKQHPNNDRSITNYFYLDISKDSRYADPGASVTGPLNFEEFSKKKIELSLPSFKRTIKSIE